MGWTSQRVKSENLHRQISVVKEISNKCSYSLVTLMYLVSSLYSSFCLTFFFFPSFSRESVTTGSYLKRNLSLNFNGLCHCNHSSLFIHLSCPVYRLTGEKRQKGQSVDQMALSKRDKRRVRKLHLSMRIKWEEGWHWMSISFFFFPCVWSKETRWLHSDGWYFLLLLPLRFLSFLSSSSSSFLLVLYIDVSTSEPDGSHKLHTKKPWSTWNTRERKKKKERIRVKWEAMLSWFARFNSPSSLVREDHSNPSHAVCDYGSSHNERLQQP